MTKPTRDEVNYWTERVRSLLTTEKQKLLRENSAELAEINEKAEQLALKKCGVHADAAAIDALLAEANEKIAEANAFQESANEKVSLMDGGHNASSNGWPNKRNISSFTIERGRGYGSSREWGSPQSDRVGARWVKNWSGVIYAFDEAKLELLNETPWGKKITLIDHQTGKITDAIMLATTSKQLSDTIRDIMNNLGLDHIEGLDALIKS